MLEINIIVSYIYMLLIFIFEFCLQFSVYFNRLRSLPPFSNIPI